MYDNNSTGGENGNKLLWGSYIWGDVTSHDDKVKMRTINSKATTKIIKQNYI